MYLKTYYILWNFKFNIPSHAGFKNFSIKKVLFESIEWVFCHFPKLWLISEIGGREEGGGNSDFWWTLYALYIMRVSTKMWISVKWYELTILKYIPFIAHNNFLNKSFYNSFESFNLRITVKKNRKTDKIKQLFYIYMEIFHRYRV